MDKTILTRKSIPMVTTYSLWRSFLNCGKSCYWRYVRGIKPIETAHALAFGSAIHECLERWHRGSGIEGVLDHIDFTYRDRTRNPDEKRDWHLARAMMKGYARRYPKEEFEVLALEKTFEGKIVNPKTGCASRSFTMAGKIDGIVRVKGDNVILEHKSCSQLDGNYLDRLWTDLQVTLYTLYAEQALGIPIAGVIYNVLVKARLQQSRGESEIEFEERRRQLAAKSKSGTSSAKRKLPETDEEFAKRLDEKYAEPEMFHREVLYLSRDRIGALQAELWDLTQALKDAIRKDTFFRNTSHCFQWGRPCPYFSLCQANGSAMVLENLYEKKNAHEELETCPQDGGDLLCDW